MVSTKIFQRFNPLSVGTVFLRQNPKSVDVRFWRINTSETDGCKRQILAYKEDPRNERIKIFIMAVEP